ncbi:nitrous oxidase accessory protein NosD, partial [Microvirga flocculans]
MAIFYVSTTGSDSNAGTSTSPVKTITKAAQLAQPGDTVLVHGGVYNGTVNISKNGTASAPITFKPVSGEHVIIDGSQTASGSNLVTITGDYVTFQGFEVRNAKRAGITLWDTHDTKVLDNNVHDSFRAAIWAGGSAVGNSYNNLIEGNEVWHNVLENSSRTWSGGWAQGISLDKSDGSIIRNNNVYDNYGEGIGAMFTKGAKISGNTVYDSYSVGIYLDNAQDAVVQYNMVSHTYDTNFYRNGKPATGIEIANEFGDRQLPSSGLVITNNVLGGVGTVHYSTYGANTGLINSTIAPNTVSSNPVTRPTTSTPTPTPTPDAQDHPVTAMDDGYAATEDTVLTVSASKGVLANDVAADGGKAAVAGTFATAQGGSV